MTKKSPNFDSACELFNELRDINYAKHMFDFRQRHPIMYFLWYRQWFLRAVPDNVRAHVEKNLRELNKTPLAWHTFAKYHPLLFLLCVCFQISVKLLSAPVKVIRTFKH